MVDASVWENVSVAYSAADRVFSVSVGIDMNHIILANIAGINCASSVVDYHLLFLLSQVFGSSSEDSAVWVDDNTLADSSLSLREFGSNIGSQTAGERLFAGLWLPNSLSARGDHETRWCAAGRSW